MKEIKESASGTRCAQARSDNFCYFFYFCGTLKKRLIQRTYYIIMTLFKNVPADKIGNFILTVITAFVSTFLMQSCM